MAKSNTKGTRRRFLAFASVALSVTLSLGVLAACGGNDETSVDDEDTAVAPTDTQIIKNGDFEFFSEMTKDKLEDQRNLIHSPNNWTITTVSPSSDTKSGIIDTKSETWNYLVKSGREFTGIDDAYDNWDSESATVYDRLKFLDAYNTEIGELGTGTDRRVFFDKYRSGGSDAYTIDYEDVKDLDADFPDGIALHPDVKESDSHVLMLHNYETSDNVLGTAVYATSSTTITLKGGTAAKVSVWVRTNKLRHYYDDNADVDAQKDAGAYIAVTNTVGGNSSSPQFIIKNINTDNQWEQYTVYIRANTYATTTYRLVLGLGRNPSSDNRLEAVNGYALFDDVIGETISNDAYVKATEGENELPVEVTSTLNSSAADRIKDATELAAQKASGAMEKYNRTFALDLLAEDAFETISLDEVSVDVTKETVGSLTASSKVGDNRSDGVTEENRKSIAAVKTYRELASEKDANGYLKDVFDHDFTEKFPFYQDDGVTVDEDTSVIMLLSTNGAAYTAKLRDETHFSLNKNEYMLISFFVKTSTIRTGKTGASITLVDGENRTSIGAFDSTTVSTVDIDKEQKDIYKGWVQCFFIVKNETDDETPKTFSLEFSYGPTSIVGSKTSDYADGYAAFANFECVKLTKAQANYASTGTYAKSVSLTEYTKDSTKFDDVANSYNIETGLANPANFSKENFTADDKVYSGLLNKEYRSAYFAADGDEKLQALKDMPAAQSAGDADAWWDNLFGDKRKEKLVATQPLVIYNSQGEAAPSHGYTLKNFSNTIPANTTQFISLYLKVSEGLDAHVYLYDYSDPKAGLTNGFSPALPAVTYWYDDDGNIVKGDPTADGYNEKTDVLYYLQENGLYTQAGATGDPVYYANLHNFTADDNGNLITGGDNSQIVYFRNPADGKFYAYRSGDEGAYSYSLEVHDLPLTDAENNPITRYQFDAGSDFARYSSSITVHGTAETAETWVEVSFYVRTGSEEKSYNLAVWAGQPGDADGIPANGYLFLNNYMNESTSDFDDIRDECVGILSDDPEYLVDPDDDKSNLKDAYALYYTFSFFDSPRYIRYDATQQEDSLGSPWIDYKQSDYAEGIAWMRYETLDAAEGSLQSVLFLDYSVAEVSVSEHVYDTDDDTDDDTDTDSSDSGDTNIWLIISSAVLAVALIFAIVAVIVRKLHKDRSKAKIKVVKDKKNKAKSARAKAAEPDEQNESNKPAEPDENDPYNE